MDSCDAPECARRMHQIIQPDRDRGRNYFAVFGFEPALDVVVAFAFVRLQPEFAGIFTLAFARKRSTSILRPIS